MGVGPRLAVTASLPRPARVSLISSASQPESDAEERWQNGFTWEPEGCAVTGTLDPCVGTAMTVSADDGPTEQSYDPVVVWAGYRCTTLGSAGRDWQGRALRALEACQSSLLEAEFWSGTVARAASPDLPNRYLASNDSDVLSPGTGLTPLDALACLEQGLAECNCGQRGMIHATRQVVTHWANGGALRREGNLLLTVNDTIVVPGAGYTGSGPNALEGGAPIDAANGAIWAYATGIVDVRLSTTPQVLPRSLDEFAAVDYELNTAIVRAYRFAAATWDGCCHLACQIDLDLCQVGGPGS